MHIYCSGIGGVGIGPLGLLALDAGYQVSGSDLHESEMTALLTSRGADVQIGQDGTQILGVHTKMPIDWFVYSSALPTDHPELLFAKEHNIKISKRDEFLNTLMNEQSLDLVAVAGTHGKTTTTGILIWLFNRLSIPVSYSIGTSISFGPPAQYQKESRFFIYECDEFDRNFLQFKPRQSVIASFDYDHPDTYPTQADYTYAFQDFVSKSQDTILWQDDADALELSDLSSIEILSDTDPGINLIKLPGAHTRRNAWLAIQTVHELFPELELDELTDIVASFPGTNRRFEKLAPSFYSDYAHHPVEIVATIQAATEINKNVVVVYQPHQNIRQHEIMAEGGYKNSFSDAKHVYWLPT
ncbi:hypothetical protein KBD20_04350, partial [Candidatus Saccharibacteria bacterium]|nr:hypothetical protein [Candidatus Saccharibacteria bacterium]